MLDDRGTIYIKPGRIANSKVKFMAGHRDNLLKRYRPQRLLSECIGAARKFDDLDGEWLGKMTLELKFLANSKTQTGG
jgi:hypothetical protein